MLNNALKLLKEIDDNGFVSYIVGGFVRDYLLGIESNDIDICTNATPKDIKEIFKDNCLPSEDYGSVTVVIKNINYEITTFRKDIGYNDNRHPSEIKYIDSLEEDLLRRDFTINTICMDKDGKIVDHLNGIEDLKKRIIRSVGNADKKFSEDALRILRAIRFATILDFKLDDTVKKLDLINIDDECSLELNTSEWIPLTLENLEQKIQDANQRVNLTENTSNYQSKLNLKKAFATGLIFSIIGVLLMLSSLLPIAKFGVLLIVGSISTVAGFVILAVTYFKNKNNSNEQPLNLNNLPNQFQNESKAPENQNAKDKLPPEQENKNNSLNK